MSTPGAPLDSGTRLAIERTQLANERNMMAWIRTAASLISFGFTVYKFFDFEAGKNAAVAGRLITPRMFGVFMIGIGLVALLLSTIEHRQTVRRLALETGPARPTVAGVLAALIAVLGLMAFGAALFHG